MSEYSVFLSLVPGIEAMWTSAYLICSSRYSLIPLAVVLNFISVFVFIKLLDASKLPSIVNKFLEQKIYKKMNKLENWFNKYGSYAILLLISLPLSGIGSFSGAFIAKVFGISGFKLYSIIFISILLSLVPAFLISYGINIIGITC